MRYESLEVTQQIMSSDYSASAADISGRRFIVEKRQVADASSAVASFVIREGGQEEEDVDDPEEDQQEQQQQGRKNGQWFSEMLEQVRLSAKTFIKAFFKTGPIRLGGY